jgi:hypothetical protein
VISSFYQVSSLTLHCLAKSLLTTGAVVTIVSFLKGMSSMLKAIPPGIIRKIYKRLKIVADMDEDNITKGHAKVALDEMRGMFFGQ